MVIFKRTFPLPSGNMIGVICAKTFEATRNRFLIDSRINKKKAVIITIISEQARAQRYLKIC